MESELWALCSDVIDNQVQVNLSQSDVSQQLLAFLSSIYHRLSATVKWYKYETLPIDH